MAKRATHDGQCQVCGQTQRLPGGVLAKHGYTTKWGFFSGTCYGSGALPFELAKDLTEESIGRALDQAKSAQALAHKARTATEGPVWVHEYHNYSYTWRQVELALEGGHIITFVYIGLDGKAKRIQSHNAGYAKTIDAVRTHLGAARAYDYDRDAKGLLGYVRYQRERLVNWAVKPLRPRGDK